MKKSFINILLIIGATLLTGCTTAKTGNIPSDFLFIMDVKSAGDFEGCVVNVHIRIDANGSGRYETYNTDCAIEYDTNGMVTYQLNQIIKKGQFKLNDAQLESLWGSINKNNFFNLTEDYRMAIGFSYAFIVVEADGQQPARCTPAPLLPRSGWTAARGRQHRYGSP